jgi:hypothetical protein
MSHFPHGAFVAVHAAQQQQKEFEQEEEEMTKYSSEDLEQNWEFKIVRSQSNAFRNPATFQALLEEEALAGWELVEKLDNRRVRFKRSRDTRRRDSTLPPGIDSYRTQYGAGSGPAVAIGLVVALLLGVAVFAMTLFTSAPDNPAPTIAIIIGITVLVSLAAIVVAAVRMRSG